MSTHKIRVAAYLALVSLLAGAARLWAQEKKPATPVEALTDALMAACRQQRESFSQYLPGDSAKAFGQLPQERQVNLMQRLVAVTQAGSPLLSTATDGSSVLRCSSPSETTEMRLGKGRVEENLAFVAVSVPGGRTAEFGLVRESGGWKLLSVGLLVLNIPELNRQWDAQKTVALELRAVAALRQIAEAVESYRKAFGSLPESLAQLGPSREGVSPEAANLIDGELAAGAKENYLFRYRAFSTSRDTAARYEMAATPAKYGAGGRRSFYLDSSGVLRGGDKNGAVATEEDPRMDQHRLDTPQ